MRGSVVFVSGELVDLDSDFSVTVERFGQLLRFHELVDIWGFDMSFPLTGTNARLFEMEHRVDKIREGVWRSFPMRFEFDGVVILEGSVKVRWSGERFEGVAVSGLNDLKDGLKRMLRSFDFGKMQIPWSKVEFSPDDDPFCLFEVYNPGFYRDRGASGEGLTAADGVEYAKRLEAKFVDEAMSRQNRFEGGKFKRANFEYVSLNFEGVVISPFYFVWWLVQQVFKHLDCGIVESELQTNDQLKRACLYSNFDVHQWKFVDIDADGGFQYYKKWLDWFKVKNCLPSMSVEEFLEGIGNYFNVFFTVGDDRGVRILGREERLRAAADQDISDLIQGDWDIGFKEHEGVELRMDLGDDDRYEELNSEQWARFKGEVLPEDLPSDAKIGTIYRLSNSLKYVVWREMEVPVEEGSEEMKTVIGWDHLSVAGQPYRVVHGDGDVEEIESVFSGVEWNGVCCVDCQGNADQFANEFADVPLKVMFYRGLVNGAPSGDPRGVGDGELSNYLVEGERSLKDVRWRETIRVHGDGVPVANRLRMSAAAFKQFDINSKARCDEMEVVVNKMSCQFGLLDMGFVEIEGVKVG